MIPATEKVPKTVLGRGLSALIPQAGSVPIAGEISDRNILRIPIEAVHRDGNQPRKVFDEARLKELADSIRAQGFIQPVLVRRDSDGYRLIAGERRWRAAQLAGLKEIPALVREATDAEAFEIALVENLQRADLNPIEEAEGYRRLMSDHSLTQEMVSQRVGKDRSTIANSVRLLALPAGVKSLVSSGELSMGHARALLGLTEPSDILETAQKVLAKSLSVRQTERMVQRKKSVSGTRKSAKAGQENVHLRQLVEELQRALNTRVRLFDRGGKGKLEIEFFSYADLDRLASRLRR